MAAGGWRSPFAAAADRGRSLSCGFEECEFRRGAAPALDTGAPFSAHDAENPFLPYTLGGRRGGHIRRLRPFQPSPPSPKPIINGDLFMADQNNPDDEHAAGLARERTLARLMEAAAVLAAARIAPS